MVRIGDVHLIILSAPSAVFQGLLESPMDYLAHGLISLGEMVLGFVFGFLVGSAIFLLILVQTLLGLSTVEPEAIEFGRSLKMSEAAIFRKIRLPSALPAIMVGVKLGITYALTNVVVAEMLVAREGLGFLVVEAKTSLGTAQLIATIVVVTMIGLFLYAIGVTVERRTTAWYADEG